MNTENIMEYSNKSMMVESLIKSDVNFETFSQLPLVAEMNSADVMALFGCMTAKNYTEGETVYQAGEDAAGRMHIILDGNINVKSESGYKYASLRSGDVFGLFSFLDENRKHSATIIVERALTVLTMDRSYFNLIAIEEPKLGNKLMSLMFSLLSKKASELEVEYSHMHNFAFGGKV